MSSEVRHLALVTETSTVSKGDLMRVAAALQKQALRDLAPYWAIGATVDAFDVLEDVPTDYWPMIVMDDIGYEGAAGIHLDRNGQPYSLINASSDLDRWSLTASHEAVEMLVDPYGDRLVAGDSIHPQQGRVNYLVEAADPSEAAQYGYSVNGILVSDFYTPHFFDPTPTAGIRYSFTDAIKKPRQVLPGGYLSWHDPISNHWWQQLWFGGSAPQFRDLGVLTGQGSLRSRIDSVTEGRLHSMAPARSAAVLAGLPVAALQDAGGPRADRLREDISALLR